MINKKEELRSKMLNKARKAGMQAFNEGKNAEDYPRKYVYGSEAHHEWLRGYYDAKNS